MTQMTLERLSTGQKFVFVHDDWVVLNDKLDGIVEIPRYHDNQQDMLKGTCCNDGQMDTGETTRDNTASHVYSLYIW